MVLADRLNNFFYTLKVIWNKRKNMKLDIAINYVCSWLFFYVSTLKHMLVLKLCKTYDFSVFAAISLAVTFKIRKVDYR